MPEPSTIYLILDGADAVGTSSRADALAEDLRSAGVVARAYHHPRHPEGFDGVARVCFYAGARAQLLAEDARLRRTLDLCGDTEPRVVVMDRGPWSGVVHARSLFAEPSPAVDLAVREAASEPWRSAPTVVLDAAADVLDARLRARGEDPAAAWPERAEWAKVAAPRVDTGRDVAEVRASLLAWALDAVRPGRFGR